MTDEQIEAAGEVLSWMSDQASAIGSTEGVQMAGHLILANFYLTEYRAHLVAGLTQAEAAAETAKGSLKLT